MRIERGRFTITLNDGSLYFITPFTENGKIRYTVIVGNHTVVLMGNPHWEEGGAFLVPLVAFDDIEEGLLEEISDKIEDHVC